LLEVVYGEVKEEADKVISSQGSGGVSLNIINDESDAMNKNRITNLPLNTSDLSI
jgi:hypothetical protein